MYGFQIAVEFRKIEWLDARHLDGTLAFLRSRDIPYVAVDTPQGHDSSMPPLHEVTSSKLAVVRFHGRNHETWDLRNAPPNVRFRYDYPDADLQEWVPRIKEMERSAEHAGDADAAGGAHRTARVIRPAARLGGDRRGAPGNGRGPARQPRPQGKGHPWRRRSIDRWHRGRHRSGPEHLPSVCR